MSDARASLNTRVLDALQAHGPASPVEVGRVLGLDRYPVRESLERLRRRSLAQPVGMTEPGRTWGIRAPPVIWEASSAA
jgi:predicted ArsR family transcriptional regulator